MDPCVCDPSARGTMPAATDAAEPLDEPPGVCSAFQGFVVGPGWRQANSVVTVLPKITPPSWRIFAMMGASSLGILPL